MQIQFIDNAAIDRRARKLIRSHAAKGKNVGKRRKPRPPPHLGVRRVDTLALASTSTALQPAQGPYVPIPKDDAKTDAALPTLSMNNGILLYSFPVDLTPKSRHLIGNFFSLLPSSLFRPELRRNISYDLFASIWVQFVFVDEAYFNCVVAICSVTTKILTSQPEDADESAPYLIRAIGLLNTKLSGPDALSDTAMAAVVAMTMYERVQSQYHRGLVHLEGLQRMVELRGGIAQLVRNKPELAQKIFRADLDFALHLGFPTLYTISDKPGGAIMASLRERFQQHTDQVFGINAKIASNLPPTLQDVLLDALALSALLNCTSSDGMKLKGYAFHDAIIYLGYKLLSLDPFTDLGNLCDLESTVQLGLLSFTVSLLMGLGRQVAEFPVLSSLVRLTLKKSSHGDQESTEALLWALLIGRISLLGPMDDAWLLPMIRVIAEALLLQTWNDARQILAKFPWANPVHGDVGEVVWNNSVHHLGTLIESSLISSSVFN